MRHQPGNEHGPRDATLLTAGTVGVTFGVLSVVNHGIFEILQGDGPTGGPVIAAIGPEQRFWPLGTEDAFTLLPTFLLSGVASVIVGALIVLWSLRYLDTPAGATVFLGLFVAGFLVGGGMGHVAFFLPAWAFLATRRRHSRWLAGVLPVRARALMGHLWMPTLVLATLMTVLGVWIAVTGAVPWAAAPEAVQNLAMLAILGAAVLFVVAFVVAPAHTAAEPAAPTPSSARPATSGGRRPMDQPPVMPPAVIEVRDVHKSYERVEAVRGVSFDVRRGEVFGLLGPNGAGKTTLLAVLEGQQPADSGTATVLGLDVATRSREIAGSIGVQLQRTSLLPELSVAQQLSLFAALYGVGLTAPDRGALLEHVGLADSANALPDELSGGQRQRVALALALVNRPDILFLDEPTTGLDPHARRRLWETIRSLAAAQRTVLLTTHYMDEAEALCDRVGLIDEGRLVALDTPGALINRYAQAATVTTTARLPEDALRRESGVTSVRATNGTTRITTTDVPRTVQAVLDAAGGRQLDDLYVDQPDLEDVFIRLTGRTMHEGEPR